MTGFSIFWIFIIKKFGSVTKFTGVDEPVLVVYFAALFEFRPMFEKPMHTPHWL